MNKNILLLIIGIIIVSSIVFSSPMYTYKRDSKVNLTIECLDIDNNYCDSSADCNITIKKPDGAFLIKNKKMSDNPSYYNYTLDASQTKKLGEYEVSVLCMGNTTGFSKFTFEITPTGNQPLNEAGGLTSLGLIIAAIAGAFLFMIFSFKFSESDNLFPISLLFMCISFLLTIYSIYLGYIYSESILYSLPVSGGQNAIFQGILWVMVFLVVVGMIFLTIKIIKMYNIKKLKNEYGEDYNPETGYE